jgi:hypothetical protein
MIRKPELTCDSMLSIKHAPHEPTRAYINKFVEYAYRVSNFDDKIAFLALRKWLLKGQLHFEACKHIFSTLREFINFTNAYIQDEENAYSSEEDRKQSN